MLTSIFARALVFCQPGQTHCFQRHSYQSQTRFTSIWSSNLTETQVDTIGQHSRSGLTVCSLFIDEASSVQTQMKSPYKLQRIFLSLLYCILYCIILQFSCCNLSVAHLDLIFQYQIWSMGWFVAPRPHAVSIQWLLTAIALVFCVTLDRSAVCNFHIQSTFTLKLPRPSILSWVILIQLGCYPSC